MQTQRWDGFFDSADLKSLGAANFTSFHFKWPLFSIGNHPFSGAILRYLCMFNGKFKKKWPVNVRHCALTEYTRSPTTMWFARAFLRGCVWLQRERLKRQCLRRYSSEYVYIAKAAVLHLVSGLSCAHEFPGAVYQPRHVFQNDDFGSKLCMHISRRSYFASLGISDPAEIPNYQVSKDWCICVLETRNCASKTRNCVSKTRNCASKTRNCVSKTRNCVFKIMIFCRSSCGRLCWPLGRAIVITRHDFISFYFITFSAYFCGPFLAGLGYCNVLCSTIRGASA